MGSDERVDLFAERGHATSSRRAGGRRSSERAASKFAPFRPRLGAGLAGADRIAGAEDVAELEQLGIDVTPRDRSRLRDCRPLLAEERLRLLRRGFGVETLVPDLAAADAADRRRRKRGSRRAGCRRACRAAAPSTASTWTSLTSWTPSRRLIPRSHARCRSGRRSREADPGHRDRRRRERNRRRPPRLRATGRPSRARVALGRAADGVRDRPRRELRHRRADHGAPRRSPRPGRPGGKRGRLHRIAELRHLGARRRPGRDPARRVRRPKALIGARTAAPPRRPTRSSRARRAARAST